MELSSICVYCGSSKGADAALAAGGEVRGVIPRDLFRRDVPHQGLTELIEVDSMHERKQKMFELADAFVALPGGLGTREELTEMATWAQLGLHHKPIATLDVKGFWNNYHALRREAVGFGFMRPEHLALMVEVDEVDDLLAALQSYSAPRVEKRIDLNET